MYIKLSTLEYPRYEGDIRLEYPDILETETGETFPCPDTYAPVAFVQMPTYNHETQCVEELPPVQIEGVWTQQLLMRDLTADEISAREAWIAETKRLTDLRKAGLTQQTLQP